MTEVNYDRLPDRTRLQFFRNLRAFRAHAEKHFLSSNELWSEVLGDSFPRDDPDRWDERTVRMVYEQVVKVLDAGILFAQDRPLFVRFTEWRCPMNGGPSRQNAGIYLLAEPGYVMVVEADIVKTAFFCGKHRHDPSFVRFEAGWNYI